MVGYFGVEKANQNKGRAFILQYPCYGVSDKNQLTDISFFCDHIVFTLFHACVLGVGYFGAEKVNQNKRGAFILQYSCYGVFSIMLTDIGYTG